MAKYSKALYASSEVEIDPKLRFLSKYVEENYDPRAKKEFLVSKSKFAKMERNDLDLHNNDTLRRESKPTNIF